MDIRQNAASQRHESERYSLNIYSIEKSIAAGIFGCCGDAKHIAEIPLVVSEFSLNISDVRVPTILNLQVPMQQPQSRAWFNRVIGKLIWLR